MIELGKKREFFWSDYLVDAEKTTAKRRLMHPEKKDIAFTFDKSTVPFPLTYFSILKDEAGFKLYYIGWHVTDRDKRYIAVLESEDGIKWEAPSLNIFDHPELGDKNNVVLDNADTGYVFYDENPACPKEEKYKIVTPYYHTYEDGHVALELWAYVSGDGYHFTLSNCIATDGHFDSHNTAHFRNGRYACYYRHFHDSEGNDAKEWINENIRDIRVTYSDDFKTWTKQRRIEFSDGLDYPLYTNGVTPYARAPHVLIGFTRRYREHPSWSQSEAALKSAPLKKSLLGHSEGSRVGRVVTDTAFMFSHDGVLWDRFNEAFFTPGYENENNWIYGDSSLSVGLVDADENTYYLYSLENYRSRDLDKPLRRYEIRKDGFAAFVAEEGEEVLVTKPLTFEGKDLYPNFSTSAFGYIFVDVLDENGDPLSEKTSYEIYGDTIDRRVCFADGTDFAELAGKPIRLRFRMRDAKLFSLKFE